MVWLVPEYSTVLVVLRLVVVAAGHTLAFVVVVLKTPFPLIVKLANGVFAVPVLLNGLVSVNVPKVLIVTIPLLAAPLVGLKSPPLILRVPLVTVISRAAMLFEEFVTVAELTSTSNLNPVVLALQFAPKIAPFVV